MTIFIGHADFAVFIIHRNVWIVAGRNDDKGVVNLPGEKQTVIHQHDRARGLKPAVMIVTRPVIATAQRGHAINPGQIRLTIVIAADRMGEVPAQPAFRRGRATNVDIFPHWPELDR